MTTLEERKAQRRAAQARYRLAHSEEIRARALATPRKPKTEEQKRKNRERMRAWAAENRDLSREKTRQWKKDNVYWRVKQLYGIGPEAVERMFGEQGGVCASCGDAISLIVGSESYRQIDHDHTKTKGDAGYVRGLLCQGCNQGLGRFQDSVKRLQNAIVYLESHAQ
jgi:RNA polymerase-binding transcription factor DksA